MTHSLWKTAIRAVIALTAGISLAACSEKNTETPNPFEGKPEKTNPTTLSDVNGAAAGTAFSDVECLTVVATNSQGLILQEFQSTKPSDCIYAYSERHTTSK